MPQKSLAQRIQRELAHQDGLEDIVAGEADGGAIILSGHVQRDADRARAAQIARALAPNRHIRNLLEVERLVIEDLEDTEGVDVDEVAAEDDEQIPPARPRAIADPTDEEEVPLETDDLNVVNPDLADDFPEVEEDPAYFPPTDPVITEGPHGDVEILGGWAPSADSDQEVAASAEDTQPGDEALAEAITRELREDAATTELRIHVRVERGVAFLYGRVPDLADAENAEAVASRVPGVREVVELLDVAGM